MDFGVVMHVSGSEVNARKVDDPIMELVMTRRNEASLLAVKFVADFKCHTTSVTMFF